MLYAHQNTEKEEREWLKILLTGGKKQQKTLKLMWNLKWIYLMLLPVVAYYIIFKYIPMYGVTIAFKDYNVFKGMLESPWVGFKVFEKNICQQKF